MCTLYGYVHRIIIQRHTGRHSLSLAKKRNKQSIFYASINEYNTIVWVEKRQGKVRLFTKVIAVFKCVMRWGRWGCQSCPHPR